MILAVTALVIALIALGISVWSLGDLLGWW